MSELTRSMPDERYFMNSLLNAALPLGLADEALIQSLQRDLHALTHRLHAPRESVQFSLNVHLMRLEPNEALAQLRSRPLEDCFRDGLARVKSLTKSAELLHHTELARPLPADNELLRSVLRERIPEFFRLYRPERSAHELHTILDYPVLFYPQGYRGIEFVRRYLDSLVLENRFLRLFPQDVLKCCLTLYAARNGFNLQNLYGNLFEIVLACTVAKFDSPGAMLDSLGCDSPALRGYVRRVCAAYATDLGRILHQMS